MRPRWYRWLLLLAGVVLVLLLGSRSGSYLIVNRPEKVDVLVVLAGDRHDARYWRGLELLRAGYGQQMIIDAQDELIFGHSEPALAVELLRQTAGELQPRISVCPIQGLSTAAEAADLVPCLARLQPTPRTAMLVTGDFHTRRALSIFRARLPRYRWTAAAAQDNVLFGQPWWRRREWAKTNLTEWAKMLWWELIERHER